MSMTPHECTGPCRAHRCRRSRRLRVRPGTHASWRLRRSRRVFGASSSETFSARGNVRPPPIPKTAVTVKSDTQSGEAGQGLKVVQEEVEVQAQALRSAGKKEVRAPNRKPRRQTGGLSKCRLQKIGTLLLWAFCSAASSWWRWSACVLGIRRGDCAVRAVRGGISARARYHDRSAAWAAKARFRCSAENLRRYAGASCASGPAWTSCRRA